MKKTLKGIIAAIALVGAGTALAGDWSTVVLDTSSLIRQISLTGGGTQLRVMQPRLAVTASNGVLTKFTTWFDVYLPGDGLSDAVKLFSTAPRSASYPTLPCTNPVPGSVDSMEMPKFYGRQGGTSAVVVWKLQISCVEQGQGKREANATFVYSANVDQAVGGTYTGTVWVKGYFRELLGTNAADFDQNGINETLVLSMLEPNGTGTALYSRVILLDFMNGAVIKNQLFLLTTTP